MKTEQYNRAIKQLGRVNFALAVQWGRGDSAPETVADALRLMESRKNGKRYRTKAAQREAAEALRDVASTIFWARRRARRSKGCEWRGSRGKRANVLGVNAIATLPAGSLRDRANERVKNLVRSWMRRNCPDYSGDTEIIVGFGHPSAQTTTERGEQYSSGCTYRKTDATHSVTVPQDYWARVVLRGMVFPDGLLTLDLEPITHDSRTVYRAKWARVSGKRLVMESGFIAADGLRTAHAKTPQGACGILTRRENVERLSRISRKIREKLESRRLNGYAQIEVTLADSYRAGNCKPGTLAFRDRHFPGRESCTVEELMRVDSQRGLAINAALQAIRRVNAIG